jgi:predicted short-subunit dehydrogenase-like oxidoreductase (DUF2520 family)
LSNYLNIVIIGAGNVAQHIADSFSSHSNLKLVQVFNHQVSKQAKSFAKKYNCNIVADYAAIITNADLYIIAVKDDAIVEVANNLKSLKLKGLVVHTSGSINLNVLKGVSKNIGVYYPLQTFSKDVKINWKTTPLLIEGNTKIGLQRLQKIAITLSNTVKEVKSNQRLQFHLAAVFVCNFTNALYVSAFELIEKSSTIKDTRLLMPIMNSTFLKLQELSPINAQTGPAVRNDKVVMKKHLELLKDNKQLSILYKLLSELIMTQQRLK